MQLQVNFIFKYWTWDITHLISGLYLYFFVLFWICTFDIRIVFVLLWHVGDSPFNFLALALASWLASLARASACVVVFKMSRRLCSFNVQSIQKSSFCLDKKRSLEKIVHRTSNKFSFTRVFFFPVMWCVCVCLMLFSLVIFSSPHRNRIFFLSNLYVVHWTSRDVNIFWRPNLKLSNSIKFVLLFCWDYGEHS